MSTKAHSTMMNGFANTDERSMGVLKMLEEVYPAFAQKIFEGNDLMRNLIMTGYNPMDILDYPICGKCERIAVFSGYGKVYGRQVQQCACMAEGCGHTTNSPITLREFIMYELKKRVKSEEFAVAIEYAIDGIAASMMNKHVKELKATMLEHNFNAQEKTGILLADGTVYQPDNPTIKHYGLDTPELPDDIIITEEDFKHD
jgi:hypothetical protein